LSGRNFHGPSFREPRFSGLGAEQHKSRHLHHLVTSFDYPVSRRVYMVNPHLRSKRHRKPDKNSLFNRAAKHEENGELRSAFRLYLAGAKAGDSGCQINVGNFYDAGTGVRRNRSAALYWYKRAYRRGDSSAANNIGILWRNANNPKRALGWFQRAVRLGDAEANLEIAKHYLRNERNLHKAIRHLEKVCQSNWVTEAGEEEATKLLKQTRVQLKRG
jgi:TPR repeat protein